MLREAKITSASGRRGMTLIEVVIAIALAAILSAGMYGSAIYTMRQTAKNVEHIYAVQLAASEVARVRASRFDKLSADPDTLTAADYEYRFKQPRTVKMDPSDSNSQTFTVTYKFTGFGLGIKDQGNHVRLSLAPQSADWKADQFVNHLLVVTGGQGVNQVMLVTKHTKSVVTQGEPGKKVELWGTTDLEDSTSSDGWLGVTPNDNSSFGIDYGMYCDVEVSWDDGAGYKTVKETVYVPISQ